MMLWATWALCMFGMLVCSTIRLAIPTIGVSQRTADVGRGGFHFGTLVCGGVWLYIMMLSTGNMAFHFGLNSASWTRFHPELSWVMVIGTVWILSGILFGSLALQEKCNGCDTGEVDHSLLTSRQRQSCGQCAARHIFDSVICSVFALSSIVLISWFAVELLTVNKLRDNILI